MVICPQGQYPYLPPNATSGIGTRLVSVLASRVIDKAIVLFTKRMPTNISGYCFKYMHMYILGGQDLRLTRYLI